MTGDTSWFANAHGSAVSRREPPALSWAERFRGALLGGAVGDALGAGVRTRSAWEIQQWFGTQGVTDYLPVFGRRGGVTELTQLAVFTLEALLRAKAVNGTAADWLPTPVIRTNHLRWLYTQGVPWEFAMSGYLRTHPEPSGWLLECPQLFSTRNPAGGALAGLGRLAQQPPVQTGFDPRSGPVVRPGFADCAVWAAPTMVWSRSEERVFAAGADVARLLTDDLNVQGAAGFHADLLAQLIQGDIGLWEAAGLTDARLSSLRTAAGSPAAVRRAVHAAMFATRDGRRPQPSELDAEFDTEQQPGELGTALAAVGATGNFADAVLMAVNVSADSSVTGALAGQLAGALYGPAAIPPRWLGELELTEIIETLCADAAEAFAPPPPPPPLPKWAQRYVADPRRAAPEPPRELGTAAPPAARPAEPVGSNDTTMVIDLRDVGAAGPDSAPAPRSGRPEVDGGPDLRGPDTSEIPVVVPDEPAPAQQASWESGSSAEVSAEPARAHAEQAEAVGGHRGDDVRFARQEAEPAGRREGAADSAAEADADRPPMPGSPELNLFGLSAERTDRAELARLAKLVSLRPEEAGRIPAEPDARPGQGDHPAPDERGAPVADLAPGQDFARGQDFAQDEPVAQDDGFGPAEHRGQDEDFARDEHFEPDQHFERDGHAARDGYSASEERSVREGYSARDDRSARDEYAVRDDHFVPGERSDQDSHVAQHEHSAREGHFEPDGRSARNGRFAPGERLARDDHFAQDERSVRDGHFAPGERSTQEGHFAPGERSDRDVHLAQDERSAQDGHFAQDERSAEHFAPEEHSAPEEHFAAEGRSARDEHAEPDERSAPEASREDRSEADEHAAFDDRSESVDRSTMDDHAARDDVPDDRPERDDHFTPEENRALEDRAEPEGEPAPAEHRIPEPDWDSVGHGESAWTTATGEHPWFTDQPADPRDEPAHHAAGTEPLPAPEPGRRASGGHAKPEATDEVAPSLTERVLGCFLGGALGDALGSDLERASAEQISEVFGPDGPDGLREAYGVQGAITDDTQMTLFTAEGLIRGSIARRTLGAADPLPEVQLAYQRWLHTQGVEWASAAGPFHPQYPAPDGWLMEVGGLFSTRAPGKTIFKALTRFGDGHPAGSVAEPVNDSKGCGGVMRAAPAALYSPDPPVAFELAARTAALTHGHPSGYLSAGALAVIVQQAVLGRSLDDGVWLALQVLETWDGHEETSALLKAAVELAEQGAPTPRQIAETLGGGWVGEQALAIAVCAALAGADVPDALRIAVHHDGDSDSTGAICGNIVGALAGVSALPVGWLADLELRDVVEQIALDCVAEFGESLLRDPDSPEPQAERPADQEWDERYPVRSLLVAGHGDPPTALLPAVEAPAEPEPLAAFPAPKPAPRRLHGPAYDGEGAAPG